MLLQAGHVGEHMPGCMHVRMYAGVQEVWFVRVQQLEQEGRLPLRLQVLVYCPSLACLASTADIILCCK